MWTRDGSTGRSPQRLHSGRASVVSGNDDLAPCLPAFKELHVVLRVLTAEAAAARTHFDRFAIIVPTAD